MEIDKELKEARKRGAAALNSTPIAVKARYLKARKRIVVELSTGLELTFPPYLAEGLEKGTDKELSVIEITPMGTGIHWPLLDADLYVPSLLEGHFGSKNWIAKQLGSNGGRSRSKAKADASRLNGKKGGRPKKQDDTRKRA